MTMVSSGWTAAVGRGLSDTIQNSPTGPPSNQPLKREHRSERTQRPLLRRRFYRRMSGLEIFERLLRPISGPRPKQPVTLPHVNGRT